MIDTTTINYGISKLTEAWERAAPTITNVSEKYVQFVVAKAVIPIPLLLLGVIISAALFVPAVIHEQKNDWDPTIFGVIGVIGGGFGLLLCGLGLLMFIPDAALALWCPEMYTVNEIISAAR